MYRPKGNPEKEKSTEIHLLWAKGNPDEKKKNPSFKNRWRCSPPVASVSKQSKSAEQTSTSLSSPPLHTLLLQRWKNKPSVSNIFNDKQNIFFVQTKSSYQQIDRIDVDVFLFPSTPHAFAAEMEKIELSTSYLIF